MSDWDTGVAALSLVDNPANGTNGSNGANGAAPMTATSGNAGGSLKPAGADEYAEKFKSAGWTRPERYDYDTYNAKRSGPGDAPGGPAGGEQAVAPAMPAEGAVSALLTTFPEWGANAAKYEWRDEYGDVAPRVPALEKILFKSEFQQRKGEFLNVLNEVNVTVESETMIQPIKEFKDAGLHPVMLENVGHCQYSDPTPIQAYCIPAVLQNLDVIAVAQTGSGKTAAFLVPVLSKLMGKAKKLCGPKAPPTEHFDIRRDAVRAEPLVLIIVPTRELAVQIFDEARRLCYRSMLRPCVVYGGGPSREQAAELQRGCDILIGTPGRLIDFLSRGYLCSLRRVRYTILDEADELVSDDWNEDMKAIMAGGDNNEDADHRYMMFSATFPKGARQLAKEYLDDSHIRIRVGRLGSTHKNIQQSIIYCDEENKRTCLRDLLLSMKPARTIIFVNSKRAADFLDDFLYNSGLPSTSIHSDRTQREREDAIRAFKLGKAPLLVTTGVSARGLDIINVMHVINYDLPSSDHGGIHEYIHRIGRTARIGQIGAASSLYNERNEDIAPMLTKILVEAGQVVPDFLEQFKPEGPIDKIDFEDESDDEAAGEAGAENGGGGDAWGAGGDAAPAAVAPAAAAEGWGAETSAPVEVAADW